MNKNIELIRQMFANAEVEHEAGKTTFIIRDLTRKQAAILRGFQATYGYYENLQINTTHDLNSAIVIDDIFTTSFHILAFAARCID